ncbi:MAG: HEPN domain-containing protein [Nanoarchaeota archaeon]
MEKGYFRRLKEKRKIALIIPSLTLQNAYLDKSKKFVLSANLLLGHDFLESATADLYYSMYYSLLALLFKYGIRSKSHMTSILFLDILFQRKDLFELMRHAKRERIDKQHHIETQANSEGVTDLLDKARLFNMEIRQIIINPIPDVEEIRKKFKQL